MESTNRSGRWRPMRAASYVICIVHYWITARNTPMAAGKVLKKLRLQEESYTDHTSSIAVRLFPVASTLGIAEGIETALSAHQITHCNTWATMNTAFMKKFQAPAGVKHLVIFADADTNAAGHAAAFECAFKNLNSAANDLETITVRWPEPGADFNDVLLNGLQVYEWVYTKNKEGLGSSARRLAGFAHSS